MDSSSLWIEVVQVVGAAAGVVVAGLVALMPYVRRPYLTLELDNDGVYTRMEYRDRAYYPVVRLLVRNRRRRRAAIGVRVLVDGYWPRAPHVKPDRRAMSRDEHMARVIFGAHMVGLGHVALRWPVRSEAEAPAATVFAGARRPVDLGYLTPMWRGPDGEPTFDAVALQQVRTPESLGWCFSLAVASEGTGSDFAYVLTPRPDGYTLRLVVGADDGPAHVFDLDLDWPADERIANPLHELRANLSLRRVRSQGRALSS